MTGGIEMSWKQLVGTVSSGAARIQVEWHCLRRRSKDPPLVRRCDPACTVDPRLLVAVVGVVTVALSSDDEGGAFSGVVRNLGARRGFALFCSTPSVKLNGN